MTRPASKLELLSADLVERLSAARTMQKDAPEPQRRELFRQTLEEALQGLSAKESGVVLAGMRERLIQRAAEREDRLTQQDDRIAKLETELAAANQEADRLSAENRKLQQAPSRQPPAAAAAAADGGGSLQRLREALITMATKPNITAESIGLPASEARFFSLMQELLRFAIDYEMGVNLLLAEFSIGPAADMDTKMVRGLKQQVRARFRACLEDRDGSMQALKEILKRNARFIVDLNSAYAKSIHEGGQAMLDELDPQARLDAHKRMIGFNFEEAFRDVERTHGDLSQLSRGEVWERYYFDSFRLMLASYLDQDTRR